MNKTWQGFTCIVRRLDEDSVRKIFKQQFIWMIKREEEALKRLERYKNFPKLISVTEEYIDMSYCGVQEKIIDKTQCMQILLALRETKIVHRDVMPRNLLTKQDVIYLIDFGWCLFDNELETPIEAPKGLGKHYYEHRRWNDKEAMKKIFLEMGI